MMTVGELVAYLRLDDGQFNRGLDQAHSRIGRVGGAIGTAVKRGAVVAGAAITGLVGMTLVKGFKRLTAIEDASASLRGLGHSAEEVTAIMANARTAVLGTAFGLDEAASIAAGAVASGIKPGQQLEATLRLVADAATIGKTSLGEMGAVFNKVAASNKMQGDVMAQLNDKGIPIQQFLAKSLGVTIDKVYELSKAGSISFPMFAKAMQEGLGGAALASGNTTIGAWKNMVTALSRFGADVLSGIFPSFKVAFNKIGAYLDTLGTKYGPMFKKWGEKVSAAFKTGGFTGMFKTMLPAGWGDTLVNTFNLAKDAVVTIASVLGSISKDTLKALGQGFRITSGVSAVVAKAFVALPDSVKKFVIAAGLLALALNKFGLLGSAKGIFGGLLGKVGGGAATEVPLTTAVGLNTAATEANTLALMGRGGLPGVGVPGGGGKPVATPIPQNPRTFYVDSKGNTTTTKPSPLGGTKPSGILGKVGQVLAVVGIAVTGGELLKGTGGDVNVAMEKIAGAAGKKSGQAFANAFDPLAYFKPGLLSGLDPAILRTREKLATLRQELQKKQKLGLDTASTTAAIKRVENHLADLRAKAARPAHTGKLDTSSWLNSLSKAERALASFRDLAAAGITPGSLSQHKSWTKANTAPAPVWSPDRQHARGSAAGSFVPHTPGGTLLRVGEGKYDEVVAQVLPGNGQQSAGGVTELHLHIGQLVGTDERAARKFWSIVKPIAMSEMRLKGAMSRG